MWSCLMSCLRGLQVYSHTRESCVILRLSNCLEHAPYNNVLPLDVLFYLLSETQMRLDVVYNPLKKKR